jgi:hypothetical protein
LVFPEFPPTSDLFKDMIRKMLVVDRKFMIFLYLLFLLANKRCSWEELKKHELIKIDPEEI